MSEISESKSASSHTVLGDIKIWLSSAFKDDLDKVYKVPENELEAAKIKKIRKINLYEFAFTLGIMFITMWTFWWQGILQDNQTLEIIGYGILGVIGLWAILFSPFYHYKLEKGLTYRRGYLGLDYEQNGWTAWFEERGFGSLVQYWKKTLKDPKNSHLINFTTFWVIITILLYMVFRKSGVKNLGKNFGISEDISRRFATAAGIGISFQVVAFCLLVYSIIIVVKWTTTGDKDSPKKFILILIQSIVFALSFAFAGVYALNEDEINFISQWQMGWGDSLAVYETTFANANMAQFAYVLIGISVVMFFLLKYFLLGILVRIDNLKTAFYQFLFIMVITIVVIGSLNLIMGLDSINAYMVAHHVDNMSEIPTLDNMWYIFDNTALASRESFTFASLFANWGQYVYWGAAQQLLFLSYWNTLLTKVFKNKHINAALSSLSFGLIHFPSWPLMVLTIVAGYFWGLAWQRNACRNLFIIGASHGFGGTLVAKLIPITMSVGPSNMS